jgi:cystine transport system permease protein
MLEYAVKVTIPLTVLSFALALVVALGVALIQYARIRVLRQICRFYIWITRGTPLLVQLYIVFYGLPKVGIIIDAFPAAVVVLGLNEAAYMAETIRGTLEGVSKGQLEAGLCVGMTWPKIIWHVVLHQAMRTAFPALSNSMIAMLKETSMAATITVMELFRQAQVINGRVYEPLALYLEAALIYLMFCTILTFLQHRGEKRLGSYGGTKA